MTLQSEQLAQMKSRLREYTTVVVFVHSESPSHWTLLRRDRTVESGHRITYWESLPVESLSARVVASEFMRRLDWGDELPHIFKENAALVPLFKRVASPGVRVSNSIVRRKQKKAQI